MISIMPRQIVVVTALTAILCIVLLVGMLLILSSMIGAHASQTGIMLIAPSHQLVDLKVMVSTGF